MPALVYYYLFLLIYIFVIYLTNQDQLKKHYCSYDNLYKEWFCTAHLRTHWVSRVGLAKLALLGRTAAGVGLD